MTDDQRLVYADGEVCQGREEKQLVEVFTGWNDKGELQRGERMVFLLDNRAHETVRTVLVLVERVVADESQPFKLGVSGYLVEDVSKVLLHLHALVAFPCEPEREVPQFREGVGCLGARASVLRRIERKRAYAGDHAT